MDHMKLELTGQMLLKQPDHMLSGQWRQSPLHACSKGVAFDIGAMPLILRSSIRRLVSLGSVSLINNAYQFWAGHQAGTC